MRPQYLTTSFLTAAIVGCKSVSYASLGPERPHPLGPSGWDGIYLDTDGEYWDNTVFLESAAVTLFHEHGQRYELQRHEWCGSRWVPEQSLARGGYDSIELQGFISAQPLGTVHTWELSEGEYEVGSWGLSEDFAPANIDSAVYEIDYNSVLSCDGLWFLIREFLPPNRMLIEIVEASESSLHFRWIQELNYGEEEFEGCIYIDGTASLSSTGEMLWEEGNLVLTTEPVVEAKNAMLRMGFEPSGNSTAGIEIATTLDLAGQSFSNVDDSGDTGGSTDSEKTLWQGYCETMEEMTGRPCHECLEGELDSCIEYSFFAGQAERVEIVLDSARLPRCSVELAEVPELPECGFGCSTVRLSHRPWVFGYIAIMAFFIQRRRSR